MKNFIIYWFDGTTSSIKGNSIEDAFTKAGYGAGAVRAVDFYEEGTENTNYEYSKKEHTWKRIVPVFQPHI